MANNVAPTIDPTKTTEQPFGWHTHDMVPGDKFNRLTVLSFSGRNRKSMLIWKCKCDCGNETLALGSHLITGRKKSCGCLGREATRARSLTHGMRNTITYASWKAMKRRCEAPADIAFVKYGGAGIVICERWHSFENFFSDMGERPSKDFQIERVDNLGNYEPGNCIWATRTTQARNRRSNRMLTHDGKTMCIADWADFLGWSQGQINNRLHAGWSDEQALTQPIRPRRKSSELHP